VGRDVELVEWTGARYHVAHASAEKTFSTVREARAKGLPVTCEVTPHHFTLTDEACEGYDTNMKVAPPLRGSSHVEAVKQALSDGVVDSIATDHAPHSAVEKDTDFDTAAFGMIGLETALPLSLELVRQGVISLGEMVALLTYKPARVFGLDRLGAGSLVKGGRADLCVIDCDQKWTVDRQKVMSKSKNTPFHGRAVQGAAVLTLLGGRPVHDSLGALS